MNTEQKLPQITLKMVYKALLKIVKEKIKRKKRPTRKPRQKIESEKNVKTLKHFYNLYKDKKWEYNLGDVTTHKDGSKLVILERQLVIKPYWSDDQPIISHTKKLTKCMIRRHYIKKNTDFNFMYLTRLQNKEKCLVYEYELSNNKTQNEDPSK